MSLSLKSPGNYKGCDYENKKKHHGDNRENRMGGRGPDSMQDSG